MATILLKKGINFDTGNMGTQHMRLNLTAFCFNILVLRKELLMVNI